MTKPEPSRSNRTLDSVNTHAHDQPLFDRTIAVPETRQLDVLANLLTKRGARVLRCPLVSICDSPDVDSVTSWLARFINDPPALFILLTGEGLTRLLGFVESCGLPRSEFVNALQKTIIVARGPRTSITQALRRPSGKNPDNHGYHRAAVRNDLARRSRMRTTLRRRSEQAVDGLS